MIRLIENNRRETAGEGMRDWSREGGTWLVLRPWAGKAVHGLCPWVQELERRSFR